VILTRLEESPEYTARREDLRQAEVELMYQREKVAALRRSLPHGTAVEDYVFGEGPRDLTHGDNPITTVRLSELFSAPERVLVIQHMMFGKRQTSPCPMCTLWIDGLSGVAHHIAQNVDFAVAAAADPARLRDFARVRGWDNVRLLSCGESTFQYDLGAEDEQGNQDSTFSVFTLDPDRTPRHFYSCHPSLSDDINQRGIDLLSPVWNLLDLIPQGRGDWFASLDY